jgi:hypothetical protein
MTFNQTIPADTAPAGEQKVIDAIVQNILAMQKRTHKPGAIAKRALHGKSLGVVQGSFAVRELPEAMRVGIFAQKTSYSAVVRFSNGALTKAPDLLPNVRGAALKLYGVKGIKVLPGESDSTEQDFLMANDEIFFVKEIQHFAYLTGRDIMAILKEAPGTIARVIKATSKFVPSLATTDYFSQVPHMFGDRACKYALWHAEKAEGKDGKAQHFGPPNIFDGDYLRHDLDKRLHAEAVRYVFCVQLQQAGESISDSTKKWTGPWVPLADLTLPRIAGELKEPDGEALSFNPARSNAEFQPIGWPARLRRAAYAADFAWRNAVNAAADK